MKPTNKKNKKKEEFERRKKKVFNYLKDHVDYCRVYLNGQLCGVCVCWVELVVCGMMRERRGWFYNMLRVFL
jgi:hypothetical protein